MWASTGRAIGFCRLKKMGLKEYRQIRNPMMNEPVRLTSFDEGEEWQARTCKLVLSLNGRFACANFKFRPEKTALRNAKPFALPQATETKNSGKHKTPDTSFIFKMQ
jgi:hypothetical protein